MTPSMSKMTSSMVNFASSTLRPLGERDRAAMVVRPDHLPGPLHGDRSLVAHQCELHQPPPRVVRVDVLERIEVDHAVVISIEDEAVRSPVPDGLSLDLERAAAQSQLVLLGPECRCRDRDLPTPGRDRLDIPRTDQFLLQHFERIPDGTPLPEIPQGEE